MVLLIASTPSKLVSLMFLSQRGKEKLLNGSRSLELRVCSRTVMLIVARNCRILNTHCLVTFQTCLSLWWSFLFKQCPLRPADLGSFEQLNDECHIPTALSSRCGIDSCLLKASCSYIRISSTCATLWNPCVMKNQMSPKWSKIHSFA